MKGSKITSVNISLEDAEYIAEQGLTPTKWIKYSIKRHKKMEQLIKDLQYLIEKMQTEDINERRIKKFIAALNTIPAEKKHTLLSDLAMAVLSVEISVQRTAEILQKINDKLHYTEYADRNPN